MSDTLAINDANAVVRTVDYRILDYRDSVSADPATQVRFNRHLFESLERWGFAVLDHTPLKHDLARFIQYAEAAKVLPAALWEAIKAATFNSHGRVHDNQMGLPRDGLCYLRRQPEGVERNPHWFRNEDSPDMDRALPDSTAFIERMSDKSILINRTIMRAVAQGLELPPTFYDRSAVLNAMTDCRAFWTEPSPIDILLKRHLDYGLTTLTYCPTPGLQFRIDDNTYAPVFPGEGRIVVTAGFALQVLTNDKIKAPVHRVCNEAPDMPRTSIVMFQGGSATAPLPFLDPQSNPYLRDYPQIARLSAAHLSFIYWFLHNKNHMGASIPFERDALEQLGMA